MFRRLHLRRHIWASQRMRTCITALWTCQSTCPARCEFRGTAILMKSQVQSRLQHGILSLQVHDFIWSYLQLRSSGFIPVHDWTAAHTDLGVEKLTVRVTAYVSSQDEDHPQHNMCLHHICRKTGFHIATWNRKRFKETQQTHTRNWNSCPLLALAVHRTADIRV